MVVCLTLAVVYSAQDLLIPFTVAVLLTFILAPVVSKLVRFRIRNPVATALVTLGSKLIVLAEVATVSYQAFDLVQRLPEHRESLLGRIRSLHYTTQSPLANIQETVQTLKDEVANVAPPDDVGRDPAR